MFKRQVLMQVWQMQKTAKTQFDSKKNTPHRFYGSNAYRKQA